MIFIIILLVVLIISLPIYMVYLYNKLIKLEIIIQKEYSNIDIDLKKRSDLIPKLVEVVKAYMGHEQETLKKLIDSRNKLIDAKEKKEINEADNEVSSNLKEIFALAENYPDLKSSTNFLQLQEEINNIEETLSESRKRYNKGILNFNNHYLIYPTRIFARILGFKKQEYFQAKEEEKKVPEINFD